MVKSYAESGVDVIEETASIRTLVKQLLYNRPGLGAPVDLPGHFTGMIDFGEWYLSLCSDGVGTKVLIASELRKWDTVGIDCMAMNVNDMICIGAEPLAFVDYLAMSECPPGFMEAIGVGLNRGADLANVSIIGGETATLPELVNGFDLAGTCLGCVRKDEVVTGQKIAVGDAIVGLPSSGVHSNGYTLVRRLLSDGGVSVHDKFPGDARSWGEVLLEPTRIYVREVLSAIKDREVHGMAHITGGGLRNVPRLKEGVEFRITDPLEPQPVFSELQALGDIEDHEMYQTFNMGMGFCIVLPGREVDAVLGRLDGARTVGEVVEGSGASLPALGLRY